MGKKVEPKREMHWFNTHVRMGTARPNEVVATAGI